MDQVNDLLLLIVHSQEFKGAMANLSKEQAPNIPYCRGMLLGMFVTLQGLATFYPPDRIILLLRSVFPEDYVADAIPTSWTKEFGGPLDL